MPDGSTTEQQFYSLLDGKQTFQEISESYSGPSKCYHKLLDEAKRSATNFEQLLEFYRICMETDKNDIVIADLERNAARSLKNMIVQASRSGRRFPIHSIETLEHRINKYQALGVEQLSSRDVATTTLEYIYGDDEVHEYHLIHSLFNSTPETATPAVELFVRARLIAAISSVDRETTAFQKYLDEFRAALPDPYPDDTRSADELWNASDDTQYSDIKKVELAQAATAREMTDKRLSRYLYLTARDTAECYRHQSRRDPRRGELQLAKRQFSVLLNRFEQIFTDDEIFRIEAYLHIVLGQLKSSNEWTSQRDSENLPDPNFVAAARHYYTAAQCISPVDECRYIKYLSKSVRHQSKGAVQRDVNPHSGWMVRVRLHDTFSETLPSLVNSRDDDMLEVVTETAALHDFLYHRARAVAACIQGNSSVVRSAADKARDRIDDVPVYFNDNLLDSCEDVADGLMCEDNDGFELDIKNYKSGSHPYLPTNRRVALCQIKQMIQNDEYESALDIAGKHFEQNTPIVVAVQVLANVESNGVSFSKSNMNKLIGVKTAEYWTFTMWVHLVTSHGLSAGIRDSLENMLFNL